MERKHHRQSLRDTEREIASRNAINRESQKASLSTKTPAKDLPKDYTARKPAYRFIESPEVGQNCSENPDFEESLTNKLICAQTNFNSFLVRTGLQDWLAEAFETAFREDSFGFIDHPNEFINTYFQLSRRDDHKVQTLKRRFWILTTDKERLREENARLLQETQAAIWTGKMSNSQNLTESKQTSVNESFATKQDQGLSKMEPFYGATERPPNTEGNGKNEVYGYDEYPFFYDDNEYSQEIFLEEVEAKPRHSIGSSALQINTMDPNHYEVALKRDESSHLAVGTHTGLESTLSGSRGPLAKPRATKSSGPKRSSGVHLNTTGSKTQPHEKHSAIREHSKGGQWI